MTLTDKLDAMVADAERSARGWHSVGGPMRTDHCIPATVSAALCQVARAAELQRPRSHALHGALTALERALSEADRE